MPDDTFRPPHLLTTALLGALLSADVPEGHMMRAWLDSWSGVGHVVESMRDIGYNVRLTRSPFVWWAEFSRDEVSPVPRWIGRAHHATPWGAVQWAAAGGGRGAMGPKNARQMWSPGRSPLHAS